MCLRNGKRFKNELGSLLARRKAGPQVQILLIGSPLAYPRRLGVVGIRNPHAERRMDYEPLQKTGGSKMIAEVHQSVAFAHGLILGGVLVAFALLVTRK
jgi:hypothetical protein